MVGNRDGREIPFLFPTTTELDRLIKSIYLFGGKLLDFPNLKQFVVLQNTLLIHGNNGCLIYIYPVKYFFGGPYG